MEREDPTAAQAALKSPEPPDTEATVTHADEGNGPFGADMSRIKGGTRQPSAEAGHPGSAYSTGTSTSGHSTSPLDPRSTYAPRTEATGSEAAPDPAAGQSPSKEAPDPAARPDIRWDP
ncbi:hypothetical protein [Deinococcus navajonensis]|uniref:Uncharacterized protein n=1 Tax=Deinococcus navajonensis TaxID=309884 RepID=A0ABV8XHE6_9DEIO